MTSLRVYLVLCELQQDKEVMKRYVHEAWKAIINKLLKANQDPEMLPECGDRKNWRNMFGRVLENLCVKSLLLEEASSCRY